MIPRLFTLTFFLCGSLLWAEEPSYTLHADLIYSEAGGIPQELDIYLPKDAAGPLPVVVYVHGGGWKNGSKKNPRNLFLVEHGYAVVAINYRLTDEGQWPAQIDDCRESIRWLRKNAKKYQLDADHIGVWGGSAGGHLVALMGTLPYDKNETVSSRVQAVCDWYGPTELLSMPPNNVGNGRTEDDVANSNGAKLLGCTVKDCPELARQASGLDQVSPDDAPFLIMHGDMDPGVPLSQSTRFYEKLNAHGVYAELDILEGAGHGGPLFATNEVQERIRSFFDRFLK